MPWSLDKRTEGWCVVSEGGKVEGYHDSRVDAIKQQRALYANESRVASMYAELDVLEEASEVVEKSVSAMAEAVSGSELVKIVVGNEQDKALTASVIHSIDAISERLAATEEVNRAMVAALQSMGQMAPVINLPPTQVTVEPAQVTVEAPHITVEQPDIHMKTPQVNVFNEIVPPKTSKTITFERDLSGRVTQADVVEGGELIG